MRRAASNGLPSGPVGGQQRELVWGLTSVKYGPRLAPPLPEASASPHSARDLTAFQQTILTVLAEEPRYGLAIKRALESYYDEEVNHGRLYPNLDDLVGQGLVEKSELDKRTNEYALTEEGLAAVEDLLSWTLDRYVTDDERADFVEGLVGAALEG